MSTTATVKDEFPLAVGVPEMIPARLRVSPGESCPELIDQVYGAVPPTACSVSEKNVPWAAVAAGVVAMLICIGDISIVTTVDWVRAGISLSLTATVKLAMPVVIGVPERIPVDEPSESPAGKLPEESCHTYPGVPPTTLRAFENATPSAAKSVVVAAMLNDAGATRILKDETFWFVPESRSVKPMMETPLAVGVPEITPVDEARDMPEGSEPDVTAQV